MGDVGSEVLVVEDDDELRDTVAEVLREEGFSVSSASNGLEALGYLDAHPPPRVIVLDLMMPVMSGSEFRKRQLDDPRYATIPVIVMSSAADGHAFAKSLRVDTFLAKPPTMDVLIRAVAKFR